MSIEYLMEQKLEKDRAAAVQAHQQQVPTTPSEAAVVRNGHRQLMALSPYLHPWAGLLGTVDVYSVNTSLRSGMPLDRRASGATSDWYGLGSQLEYYQRTTSVFADLGRQLAFDESIVVHRGLGLPDQTKPDAVDVANIGKHITFGHRPDLYFTEKGFGFATPNRLDALLYDGADRLPSTPPPQLVRLELTAFSGLAIPAVEHRSRELFEHIYDDRFLRSSMCQVIFPPSTEWKITDVRQGAETVPGTGTPVTVVKMTQAWPKWA
ncbi:hypothetical protein SB749_12270 [Brevibacterium sp. SIMBA_078]|uniref:hypothetical protein n=1 Tax=Brevibacterium sp. SIMBA_078 TaxID=3085816 RepID=UPI00397E7A64